MKLAYNLRFLFFFKYFLLLCFFILFVITGLWFKDTFTFLSNNHIFELFLISIVIFAIWSFYQTVKIIRNTKLEKSVKK